MDISKEEKQDWFERGQESTEKPLGDLSGPWRQPWHSDEDHEEREEAFQNGRKSIHNDPNQ